MRELGGEGWDGKKKQKFADIRRNKIILNRNFLLVENNPCDFCFVLLFFLWWIVLLFKSMYNIV